MTTYRLKCNCGRTVEVRGVDAGSKKLCDCGLVVNVPQLSALRDLSTDEHLTQDSGSLAISEAEHSQKSESRIGDFFFVATVLVAIVTGIYAKALVPFVGLLIILIGRAWMAAAILAQMTLPNALLVFFVPFMPLVFTMKRWDVAGLPFLYGVFGFVVMIIGLASVSAS